MFEFSSRDTTPEAEAVMIELLRRAPVWKRVEMMFDLMDTNEALIRADLHSRYPNANAAELRKRYAARVLPREDVIRIFGWDPDVEGY